MKALTVVGVLAAVGLGGWLLLRNSQAKDADGKPMVDANGKPVSNAELQSSMQGLQDWASKGMAAQKKCDADFPDKGSPEHAQCMRDNGPSGKGM